MSIIDRRTLLKLLALNGSAFLTPSLLATATTGRAQRSRAVSTSGALNVYIYGSFVIVADKKEIKLYAPDVPDKPQGVGHYYVIGSDGTPSFYLDDDAKDYLYKGITGNKNAPTFQINGAGNTNCDPSKYPVLSNVQIGNYRFLITLPYPDAINPIDIVKKGSHDFFDLPSTLKPNQISLGLRLTYNSFDPSKLGFNNVVLATGSTAEIYIVSDPHDPDRAAVQCEHSAANNAAHPQAAMKALGDMIGIVLFLDTDYCGLSFSSQRLDKIRRHMLLNTESRIPACMSLLANNT